METIEARFDWAMAFLAVVEHGSFTRAAETLGCSKAYVSKQVAALEQALGVRLLHRTTRRLRTTETGAVYLDYCRRLRDTLGEAERAVSSLRSEVRGSLRLSVPTTFGMTYLADALIALRQAYPELELEVDLSTRPRDLAGEGIDLALRFTRSPDPALIAKPLAVLHDWVVARPSAIARHGLPRHPRELAALPCLSNSHYKGDEHWLFERDGEQQPVSTRHGLRVNNYPLMKQLVLGDDCFAKLPAFLVEREVADGTLRRVLTDYSLPAVPLYLVFADQRPLPRKLRVAVDFLADWFSRPPR